MPEENPSFPAIVLDDKALLALRESIRDRMPPAHCGGCDEWGCGGYEERPEWGDEYTDVMLQGVLAVLASCQKKNP